MPAAVFVSLCQAAWPAAFTSKSHEFAEGSISSVHPTAHLGQVEMVDPLLESRVDHKTSP